MIGRERPQRVTVVLRAGEMVEVSAGLPSPSLLPANGRIVLEWAGYRKVLHALDPDLYLVYRAPKAGAYTLEASVLEDEEPLFNEMRWREAGIVQKLMPFPRLTPWPQGLQVPLRLSVRPAAFGTSKRGLVVEVEPNDSIADAQPIAIGASGHETLFVAGGADDLEYFDNGDFGKKGDDWFRIDFRGAQAKLFTANLNVIDPLVVHQLRMYTADGTEYREGANENERVHQQLEVHRSAITRRFEPGQSYWLRVESNAPGYDLQLRIRDLAPHRDPREAVRAAMYDHMTQVDAWLLNRPRGAAVERRIRDTGSLLGTHCMSCHTQSGIWGPVGAWRNGYRPETMLNLRHLINTMYECLRPTNELPEAANNTSLPPLDLGDGPAGTRVAGFNLVTLEKVVAPRRLHSAQQQRTANFVLLSNDPSGINAAGPGSNYGQAVVYRFAGEILWRAYLDTRNEKYLEAFEAKVKKLLDEPAKYIDDYANRILFLADVFPKDYALRRGGTDEAKTLADRVQTQIRSDEQALRALQKPDGLWGFNAKGSTDPKDADPAPTALALNALAALGFDDRDSTVKRGVDALLAIQDPYGRWNKNALTGFVTTAYVEHALSRLYPVQDAPARPEHYRAAPGESVADAIARLRALAQLGLTEDGGAFTGMALEGATHPAPQVRFWAYVALGAFHNEAGVPALLKGLADPVKMVREAARWGLRQTLLDDKGWDLLFPFAEGAGDLAREQLAAALVLRADAVMTRSAVGFPRLTGLLDRFLNDDPSPAVRAWASRAAWNWWIWNPPVREALNTAFLKALERDEPSALAENALRYQVEALFIANGQRANPSREHQYLELAQLFDRISKRLDHQPRPVLIKRLTAIAGTYYSQAGGDGGPGQMGYVTPGSAEMMGKAVYRYWLDAESRQDKPALQLAVESAANIVYDPLQKKLLDYASSGPQELRTIASTSLADPRLVTLNAAQEFVEPLMQQFYRGAAEPERRTELADPLVSLFSRSRWNLPASEEQQRIFYRLIVPRWPAERGRAEENTRELRQMDKDPTDWYVARALSRIVHTNPDLQTPLLRSLIPERFETPMEELYWLPGLRWMLAGPPHVPEIGESLPSNAGAAEERVVDIFLKSVSDPADSRLRNAALNMAGSINLRSHARIAPVLKKAVPEYFEPEPSAATALPDPWKRNWAYFRDFVAPELNRPNRDDQTACLGCHGVAGRVPSLELHPADARGYIRQAQLFENYRRLIDRVNEQNPEASKILRKPLNVQTGQEDGHQGGRRYNPGDRAYQILRKWALDAANLKRSHPLGQAQ
jgi:HEAT repeat protein